MHTVLHVLLIASLVVIATGVAFGLVVFLAFKYHLAIDDYRNRKLKYLHDKLSAIEGIAGDQAASFQSHWQSEKVKLRDQIAKLEKKLGIAAMVLFVACLLTVSSPVAAQASPPPIPIHGVTLGWQAVPNVTGYIVWRSTTTGGPYSPLSTLPTVAIACPITSCSWQDSNVTASTTYYYVLTAYLTSGSVTVSSVYSLEVSAAVPPDPVTPSATAPAKPVTTIK